MSSTDDQNTDNVAALTASIQQLVTQFIANGNITGATTSIKEAIEASATRNAVAIGAISASDTDAAASAKITADVATAYAKPTTTMSLHPGSQALGEIIDYSTSVGNKLYVASTMPLLGVLWDHAQGNNLSLCNMLQMRADKSG